MRRTFTLAVLGSTLAGVLLQPGVAGAAPPTVSGKVHGQRLKVVAKGRLARSLIQSRFEVLPTGGASFVLTASEKPRRGAPYQIIVIACTFPDATASLTTACIGSYSEARLRGKRFSQKIWVSEVAYDPSSGGFTGPFTVSIDSTDGATVRGRFTGSFESSQTCTTAGCVAAGDLGSASGEGAFAVPADF